MPLSSNGGKISQVLKSRYFKGLTRLHRAYSQKAFIYRQKYMVKQENKSAGRFVGLKYSGTSFSRSFLYTHRHGTRSVS